MTGVVLFPSLFDIDHWSTPLDPKWKLCCPTHRTANIVRDENIYFPSKELRAGACPCLFNLENPPTNRARLHSTYSSTPTPSPNYLLHKNNLSIFKTNANNKSTRLSSSYKRNVQSRKISSDINTPSNSWRLNELCNLAWWSFLILEIEVFRDRTNVKCEEFFFSLKKSLIKVCRSFASFYWWRVGRQ